jgi:hypothetical protein
MLDLISQFIDNAYVQVIIYFLLIGWFFIQRRHFGKISSSLNWVRTIILLLLFLYLFLNWSGTVNPSIRAASVIGMFFINISMVFNLLSNRMETHYRDALEVYGQDLDNKEKLERVWATGKRFFYSRYFIQSLFSGFVPQHFLRAIVSEKVPEDIQKILAEHGVGNAVISSQNMVAFLKQRLSQEEFIPENLQQMLKEAIDNFAQHAWITDQVNEFLHLALKNPKELYKSSWGEPSAKTSPEKSDSGDRQY